MIGRERLKSFTAGEKEAGESCSCVGNREKLRFSGVVWENSARVRPWMSRRGLRRAVSGLQWGELQGGCLVLPWPVELDLVDRCL